MPSFRRLVWSRSNAWCYWYWSRCHHRRRHCRRHVTASRTRKLWLCWKSGFSNSGILYTMISTVGPTSRTTCRVIARIWPISPHNTYRHFAVYPQNVVNWSATVTFVSIRKRQVIVIVFDYNFTIVLFVFLLLRYQLQCKPVFFFIIFCIFGDNYWWQYMTVMGGILWVRENPFLREFVLIVRKIKNSSQTSTADCVLPNPLPDCVRRVRQNPPFKTLKAGLQ